MGAFKRIGLAAEVESPENPGGLERRVALAPSGVRRLVEEGASVFVQAGAGERMGFPDREYESAGAAIEKGGDVYRGKDLVVKLKGPPMEAIRLMRPESALLCMAHIGAYPERAEEYRRRRINVLAMENIVESPERRPHEIVLSRAAVRERLSAPGREGRLQRTDVRFIGWSSRLVGGIRQAGDLNTGSLAVLAADVSRDELDVLGPDAFYFYDGREFRDGGVLDRLKEADCGLMDLAGFEERDGPAAVERCLAEEPPRPFGLRRIESLHETGQAGARYGFRLLREVTKKKLGGAVPRALVLGYGNVGMGAIHECWDQGVRRTDVLTMQTTTPGRIERWLRDADLIVNGAVLPESERGRRFLITREHARSVLGKGTVVIDLVGGSPTTRGAVESIPDNHFLTDPYSLEDGIAFSALWGWPMMGMERETALKYSGQICGVLLGRERLIDGLDSLAPGVEPALVCGPYAPGDGATR